ncbi:MULTISPECIES: hypothetical protein [unclassified Sulfitobacter]|uniref:hypothetical protein n=1 Tax=unclassified Sulfitobacter TaxID=196795 RepID=UPI000A766B8A|nr:MULTISPECIES: hypothetical protein [unclassified Sulfitobacter]
MFPSRQIADRLHQCFAAFRAPRGARPVRAVEQEVHPVLAQQAVAAVRAGGGSILQIACPDPTAEDEARDHHQAVALRLVRQERWAELSRTIRAADAKRSLTPGAMSIAELMAYGARADVVLAAEHALIDGRPDRNAPLLAGIEDLELVLEDSPEDYVVAAIVAQAHMDLGWAWRGTGWDVEVPARNRAAFAAHFERAEEILAPFADEAATSPLLAATQCALLGGSATDGRAVADRYERLIDLNPENPRPMRAMGNHLLPRWYGSYAELELEARRTASRTQAVWGAGGYTWVQFDAISCDDEACARLDLPFFVEGLHDILNRRPDPYTTNLLAAYCANSIGQAFSGNDHADHVRAQIADCAGWIVREHLTELHPMIWAHAARGFDNNLRVQCPTRFAASGRDDAMRIITSLFQGEIAAGKRVVFTETGPETRAA